MGASLRIQTVLYDSPSPQVTRWLGGVEAAVAQASRAGLVGPVDVALGDCASPGLDPDVVTELVERGEESGLASVRYEQFGANLGSAGGHNRLFALCRERAATLVVNPDALVSPGCLVALLDALQDPLVGIAEPRQIPLEHPKDYDRETGDTSWASGTCFLVRQAVLEATGGFDPETFFLYGDDVDLSWRTRMAGWRVRHVPWAVVCHDKRLDLEGRRVATRVEERFSAEVALLLPWKYGRSDLIDERQRRYLSTEHPAYLEGIAGFRERRATGRLPTPVPESEKVAQFVGNEYAVHRFSYPRG